MKKSFNLFIAMIMAIVVMTLFSCVKEEIVEPAPINITIVDSSKNYVTVIDSSRVVINGDTISIDNSSRSYADPEIDVSGGTVNGGTTNVNTGGNSGDGGGERQIVVPTGCELFQFTLTQFESAVSYEQLREDSWDEEDKFHPSLFTTTLPSESEKAICYYDGSVEGLTSLSFPFHWSKHSFDGVEYPSVWTEGKFGSEADQTREIYALLIHETVAEIVSIGRHGVYSNLNDDLEWGKLRSKFYLCGIAGNDGNASTDPTQARSLIGTDGTSIFLFIVERATSQQAFDMFVGLNICSPQSIISIGGGRSALGQKPVPVKVNITNATQL